MTEWLLVVDVSVDPKVEQEWNGWYDNKHLPEILGCPGFLNGTRYRSTGDAAPRYLTVYELSSPEALESEEFMSRRGWEIYASHVQPRVTLYQRLTKGSEE
jgi:hypothetical protein